MTLRLGSTFEEECYECDACKRREPLPDDAEETIPDPWIQAFRVNETGETIAVKILHFCSQACFDAYRASQRDA